MPKQGILTDNSTREVRYIIIDTFPPYFCRDSALLNRYFESKPLESYRPKHALIFPDGTLTRVYPTNTTIQGCGRVSPSRLKGSRLSVFDTFKNINKTSYHIGVVGDFTGPKHLGTMHPSEDQILTLLQFIDQAISKYGIGILDVMGRCHVDGKSGPGFELLDIIEGCVWEGKLDKELSRRLEVLKKKVVVAEKEAALMDKIEKGPDLIDLINNLRVSNKPYIKESSPLDWGDEPEPIISLMATLSKLLGI